MDAESARRDEHMDVFSQSWSVSYLRPMKSKRWAFFISTIYSNYSLIRYLRYNLSQRFGLILRIRPSSVDIYNHPLESSITLRIRPFTSLSNLISLIA